MEARREFARSIEALDQVFGFVTEQLPDSIDERSALHVNLAVEEIFTNMVRHNEPGGDHIAISIELGPDAVRVRLADFDVAPFDPESVAPPDLELPMAERQPGGLGLHLVKSVVDRLVYEYEDRVMSVSFVKSLRSTRV